MHICFDPLFLLARLPHQQIVSKQEMDITKHKQHIFLT